MALTPKYGNFGIVLSKNGTASGTYTDISGTTQANTALTTSYTAQGDAAVGGRYFSIVYGGSGSALSLFVDVGLSVATDVKVKVQVRYDSSGTWADIQSTRGDTGVTLAEHTFVAGSFALQTSSIASTGECRVVVKATAGGALALEDSVVVKARSL